MSKKLDDFTVLPSDSKSAYKAFVEFSEHRSSLNARDMKRLGWVDDAGDVNFHSAFKEYLSAQQSGATLYRKAADANDIAPLVWVSRIKQIAHLYTGLNELPPYEEVTKAELKAFAKMSADVESLQELPDVLAQKGILLIHERSLPGTKVDGACFKLPSGNPVIALSLRYSRLDNYWFTLLHELSHVHLHYNELDNVIVDDFDEVDEELIEKQANKLTLESFIPRSSWRNCEPKFSRAPEDVVKFADAMGVHPAIVAGRLRKELGRYDLFAEIVNEIDVRGILLDD